MNDNISIEHTTFGLMGPILHTAIHQRVVQIALSVFEPVLRTKN